MATNKTTGSRTTRSKTPKTAPQADMTQDDTELAGAANDPQTMRAETTSNAREQQSGRGTQTDAAHDRGGEHAQLIDHTYLEEEQFETVAQTLQRNLATSIALYFKFKKFHWDIRGRMFKTLHETYDEMAEQVFESIDVLAERLVMLGGSPIAAPAEVDRFATIRVPTDTIHDAREQLQQLVDDHTAITRAMRDDSSKCDEAEDPATADIYNGILHTHDMHRWMLQALLDDRKTD